MLPNSAAFGLVYNTTSYGPTPIGPPAPCFTSSGGCPYDSLNIALSPAVTVGSKPFFDTLYWNEFYASNYCDNGLDGTGTFRLDSRTNACWNDGAGTSYIPAAKFNAYTINRYRERAAVPSRIRATASSTSILVNNFERSRERDKLLTKQ